MGLSDAVPIVVTITTGHYDCNQETGIHSPKDSWIKIRVIVLICRRHGAVARRRRQNSFKVVVRHAGLRKDRLDLTV